MIQHLFQHLFQQYVYLLVCCVPALEHKSEIVEGNTKGCKDELNDEIITANYFDNWLSFKNQFWKIAIFKPLINIEISYFTLFYILLSGYFWVLIRQTNIWTHHLEGWDLIWKL